MTSTEVHFGQLEVLECLWPRGASEPEYAEVRAERQGKRGRAWRRGRACGARPPLHLPCPSQILSFPSSLGSQASTQPCAHLRHTQTLRRVSKVTAPPSPALASFPWGVPPSGPLWGLPVPALHPPHLCSNQDPQTHLGHPHTILLALFPPLMAHFGNSLPTSLPGSGKCRVAFIKQAWSPASSRLVKVPPSVPSWLLTQALLPATREASVFFLFSLKGSPAHPALTHPPAPADLSTLTLRAGPGAQLPAIITQNWPWTWLTSRQMWSWGPWTASLPCCVWPPHPLPSRLLACW